MRPKAGRGGWRGAGSGGETETERTGDPGGPWRVWADESPGHSGCRLRVGTGPRAAERAGQGRRAGEEPAAGLHRLQAQACAPQAGRALRTPLPNPSTQALRPHATLLSPACTGAGVRGTQAPAPDRSPGPPRQFLGTWGHSPGFGGHGNPIWLRTAFYTQHEASAGGPLLSQLAALPPPACRASRPGPHPCSSLPGLC